MGMSVTISVATEQDVEQIFRLQYLCFQSEAALYGNYRLPPLVQSLDSVRAEVAADCVFVARLGEEVVGSVHGTVTEDGAAAIGKLCVHPRLQGHGIGARLLRAAEAALVEERGRSGSGSAPDTAARTTCGSTARWATRRWAPPRARRRPHDRSGEAGTGDLVRGHGIGRHGRVRGEEGGPGPHAEAVSAAPAPRSQRMADSGSSTGMKR